MTTRRAFIARASGVLVALGLGITRLPARTFVTLSEWEARGAELYAQGWRIVDAEFSGAHGLVQRYLIQR